VSGCIDPRIGGMLHAYELGQLSKEDFELFSVHLLECEHCFNEVATSDTASEIVRHDEMVNRAIRNALAGSKGTAGFFERLKKWFAESISEKSGRGAPNHIPAEVLVHHADSPHLIGQDVRKHIEDHLSTCEHCRSELTAMHDNGPNDSEHHRSKGEITREMSTAHGRSGRTVRILIVDDEQMVLDGKLAGYRMFLDDHARLPDGITFEYHTARSGEEAVGKAKEVKPDLLDLDMRMGPLNGAEAANMIHQTIGPRPTVINTAYSDPEDYAAYDSIKLTKFKDYIMKTAMNIEQYSNFLIEFMYGSGIIGEAA